MGDWFTAEGLRSFDDPGVDVTALTTEGFRHELVFAALQVDRVSENSFDPARITFDQPKASASVVAQISPLGRDVWRSLVGVELVAGVHPVKAEFGPNRVHAQLERIVAVEAPLSYEAIAAGQEHPEYRGYVHGLVERIKHERRNPGSYKIRIQLGEKALEVTCQYPHLMAVQQKMLANDLESVVPLPQRGDLIRTRVRPDPARPGVVQAGRDIHLLNRPNKS